MSFSIKKFLVVMCTLTILVGCTTSEQPTPEESVPTNPEPETSVEEPVVEPPATESEADSEAAEETSEELPETSETPEEPTETETEPEAEPPAPESEPAVEEAPEQEAEPEAASTVYADGTYSASGSYSSPAGGETVGVSLTVENDIVTAVTVTPQADNETSIRYQEAFASGVSGSIVGRPLAEVGDPGKVSTSSLTGGGFAGAVNQIRGEAQL